MKSICIPLSIKPYIDDKTLKKAFSEKTHFDNLSQDLAAIKLKQEYEFLSYPRVYPRFYYIRRNQI